MDYVTWANIQRFNRIIASDLKPGERRIVQGLLAEQKAKLAGNAGATQDECAEAEREECQIQRF